jgi:hypothetical protein
MDRADTINYAVSRVRGSMKASKEDAFITDRYIYSIIVKFARVFMKRQENYSFLLRLMSVFTPLPCVELIEVDKVEACCGVQSGCKIMRTKDKIPKPYEGPCGLLLRPVSSIDSSVEIYMTEPGTYTSMTKTTSFKFNKNKYYWYLNGYLYFPDVEWETVRIEGVFEDDTSAYSCDDDNCGDCVQRQDQKMNIPGDLLAEIEQQVRAEIFPQAQIPQDQSDDKQNPMR